jgi:hypothetical protein
MTVKFYSSLEEMMQAEEEAQRKAAEYIQPWQRRIKGGDILIKNYPDFPIVCEVIDVEKEAKQLLDKGYDEIEIASWLDSYREHHMGDYRLTKCYSIVVPDGEIGDSHLSEFAGHLRKEDFINYIQKLQSGI